jgi:aminoglycoside phosphotransferase (APT) family kinase protein
MTDYVSVLGAIRPGALYRLDGDDYAGLTWLDGEQTQPTQAECDAAWATVQYQREYATVEQARREAYERDADPLFFRWQRGTGTEQEWLDAVQGVKDANPYPPAP